MFTNTLPPKGHGVIPNPVRPNPEIANTGEQLVEKKKEVSGGLALVKNNQESPLAIAPSLGWVQKSVLINTFASRELIELPLNPDLINRRIYFGSQFDLTGIGDWAILAELEFFLGNTSIGRLPMNLGDDPDGNLLNDAIVNFCPSVTSGQNPISVSYPNVVAGMENNETLYPRNERIRASRVLFRLLDVKSVDVTISSFLVFIGIESFAN